MPQKKEDVASDLADWFLASLYERSQTEIADYAGRGRRFEKLPSEKLHQQYIAFCRDAISKGDVHTNKSEMHDIEAELTLRGEQISNDEMKEEREVLLQKLKKIADEVKHDPNLLDDLFANFLKDRGNPN